MLLSDGEADQFGDARRSGREVARPVLGLAERATCRRGKGDRLRQVRKPEITEETEQRRLVEEPERPDGSCAARRNAVADGGRPLPLLIGLQRRRPPIPIGVRVREIDRKSTRLNSSHVATSYAV